MKNSSTFNSINYEIRDSIIKNTVWKENEKVDYKKFNIPKSTTKDIIFNKFQDENTFTLKKDFNSSSMIKELIEISWTITDETKLVLEKVCQKANCTFKGRKWIVWFTSEIAVSLGPWKLNGLPGLILFAKDENEDVVFEVSKVLLKQRTFNFEFPAYIDYATEKEYKQAKQTMEDGVVSGDIGIKIVSKSGQPIQNKNKTNNPIELTE